MVRNEIKAVKEESKKRNFLESIEISINLKDVDLSDPKKRINEEIVLPSGRGKDLKVALISSEEMKLKAKNADYTFSPEDVSKFVDDKKSFKKLANKVDFFVAESTLMSSIGKNLGVILGPRGKIPRPVPPGQDPTALIENLKKSVRARSRDRRTFHVPIGTREMSDDDLYNNFVTVYKRIVSRLDKGPGNIDSIYIKTTMGKAIKVETGDLND
ncbi:50S ribosomal protein L1 [Picrophilus oshimae]|uniref:Large ribosomal subunit protein uL1 n=2 Tax=Picrophilus torridus (strain ATCC 700027 / DSM 9790 / JCM 10055 / NBRC 100828 / KAW 2/3) TaxID=1122961 RepID=RL1_PICTO|nr:50S ribosomal protein L1 [Picrophilus oshimae]Q6L1X9.1 RecName: Full=Large ribosomal subunit protein uL1; AltName: Full=50S ribosomal protein L1 [Picrophilus oshimae DSM 9789]AAT43023.1 large subunit ribosomal protein L1P [Picrophilus oshimae DSM 9789]SMD30675.1 LSU ribosomal protein L1P [Picrophilus oshimae DSM 9789]